MSWAISFLACIMGLLLGSAGMFAIANASVKWYKISSFEGSSGYFIIGLTLVGAIVGSVLSVVAARVSLALIGPHWYSQLLGALAAVSIALSLVLAVSYLGVDRIPEKDGKQIVTVWEVRLPAAGTDEFASSVDPNIWPDKELRLELVSVSNYKPLGSCQAVFDRGAFRQENGQWILVASVPLFTSKGEFCVNLTLGGRDDGFWPALRPTPNAGYFQWSDWTRTNKSLEKPDDQQAIMYRFKFEQSHD